MAIRDVRLGIQAGQTAAATLVFQRVNDLQPKNLAPLDKTKETSGTTIIFQRGRLKGRQFDFTVKTYGYHDMTVYWLALAFGAATLTAAGTAWVHTFLPGGLNPLKATLQWKQVSSAGVLWFQATGCQVKTVKATIDANATLIWQFDGHGHYATNIAAPGVVTDSTANYIQPIDMSQQTLMQGSTPVVWPDPPKKFEITVDNGLTPDWAIAATRDFNRLKLGDTTGKATVDAFFDAYTGSMTAIEDTGFSAFPKIIYTAIDSTTSIGGTYHPQTVFTIPAPYVDSVTQDNTNTDTEEKGAMEFAYDPTLASLMSFALTNVLAVGIYTGT